MRASTWEFTSVLADIVARAQGRRVADWTFNHFLLPLDDDHHD